MNFYISRDYKHKYFYGSGVKARRDIERIMDNIGFRPAGLHYTISKNRIRHFLLTLVNVIYMPMRINKKDVLVVQYPAKYYNTICQFAHLCGAHVITFVHDLECFRRKRNSIKKEIRRMNLSDDLIACNPIICKWLCNNGFVGYKGTGILEPLYVFDFLSNSNNPNKKKTWSLHKIVYAGQLTREKNSFLYDFGHYIKNYTVNVYGNGFDKQYASNPDKFDIKGFMVPDQLITSAEGDFGLVWDGDSVDCCCGNWGEYLLVNTPHKISLYIRCGLPIIIWRNAAMSQFIEENGIGICVNSLRDIDIIYKNLTKEKYDKMCDNVQHINHLISEGWYFKRAISKIISKNK